MKKVFILFAFLFSFIYSYAIEWKSSGPPGKISQIVASNGRLIAVCKGGAFTSVDSGATWTRFKSGFNSDLEVYDAYTYNNVLYVGTNKNYFKSIDYGFTFTSDSNLIRDYYAFTFFNFKGVLFASTFESILSIDGIKIKTLLAGHSLKIEKFFNLGDTLVAADIWNGYFYFSLDTGKTWKDKKILASEYMNCIYPTEHGIFVGTRKGVARVAGFGDTLIDFSKGLNEANIKYITYTGKYFYTISDANLLFKSTNPELGWELDTIGLQNVAINDVFYNDGKFYLGSDEGVFIKKENETKWKNSSAGINNRTFYDIYADDSIALAGYRQRPYVSRDGGLSWKYMPGYFTGFCRVKNELLACTGTAIIYVSKDNGISWDTLKNIPGNIKIISYKNGVCIGAGEGGILRSDDEGRTWKHLLETNNLTAMAFNGSSILCGSGNGPSGRDGETYLSLDTGKTWEVKERWTPGMYSAVSFKNYLVFAYKSFIFSYPDFLGMPWYDNYGRDAYLACNKEYLLRTNITNGIRLFAGPAPEWTQVEKGPFFTEVFCMAINSSRIFAALKNGSVYFADLSTTVDKCALKSPKNTIDSLAAKIKFVWREVPNAANYQFQLSRFKDFSNLNTNLLTYDTTATVGDLLFETKYYWRVRGKFANVLGDWSDVFEFTVGDATGVKINTKNTYKIIPNPAYDFVQIIDNGEYSYDTKIYIINSLSQIAETPVITKNPQGYEFSTTNLTPGLYQIVIEKDSGRTVLPLCVIR